MTLEKVPYSDLVATDFIENKYNYVAVQFSLCVNAIFGGPVLMPVDDHFQLMAYPLVSRMRSISTTLFVHFLHEYNNDSSQFPPHPQYRKFLY